MNLISAYFKIYNTLNISLKYFYLEKFTTIYKFLYIIFYKTNILSHLFIFYSFKKIFTLIYN